MRKLNRNWKIHLIHHTHLDIGYTHTQEQVLERQFSHLEMAMDLIDASKDKPDNAQFRWNPEVTWALKQWYNQATQLQKIRFIEMIQSGHIGIDGLYGNLLTGLCRKEELRASLHQAKVFAELSETPLRSAMITDVPGWNWGLVDTLTEQGVCYLSAGPNTFDRIGYTLQELGDKPFYWVSVSGKSKILLYTHGKGYSWFHTSLNSNGEKNKVTPRKISRYLHKLEKSNYPYSTILIRYNIGSDNGPPDKNLSNIVEHWNNQYPQMQLRISTTTQAMHDFEEQYGATLPHYQGDITPYWEDGACSSARETAIAREAGERMSQITTLAKITGKSPDEQRYQEVWEQILLYNEHTWGAHNSIRKPDHPFAVDQWSWKKQRATLGSSGSKSLIESITGGTLVDTTSYESLLHIAESTNDHNPEDNQKGILQPTQNHLTVYNTHRWKVRDIIEIQTPYSGISDSSGNPLASQRLANGNLAVFTSHIPAEESCTYHLQEAVSPVYTGTGVQVTPNSLTNELVTVEINPKTGTIQSIRYKGREFLKNSSGRACNQYILLTTKFFGIQKRQPKEPIISISILDKGPLVGTLRVERKASRCNALITDITLYVGSPKIHILNRLDRPVTRKKEGIHFEFPFACNKGVLTYDSLYGTVTYGKDQLTAANKNFITPTRWVDISEQTDEPYGITTLLRDAPIFKVGSPHKDPFRSGPPTLCGWFKESPAHNGTLYSYIMNNYWMTNYKADQPGLTLFRYVLIPHKEFCVKTVERHALESAQPLIGILH